MEGRSVTYVKYLVEFYVLRTPVYIWNRIARFTHFIPFWSSLEISEGSFFDYEHQISLSSTTPKWKIQLNTQNTVDGKEDFIRDTSHQVLWMRVIKHKQSLDLPMHRFSMKVFFTISLPWGGHCTASTSVEFANIWQSTRVNCNYRNFKRHFHRYIVVVVS